MDKYYVFLEEAKDLKVLGFSVGCDRGKLVNTDLISKSIHPTDFNANHIEYVSLPLYAQAFDWFEEVHGLNSWIIPTILQDKVLHSFKINGVDYTEIGYTTKEEAQLECLKELIIIVKAKQ